MVDHRMIRMVARNPRLYSELVRTGKLPVDKKPASPLITLLESLGPRDRARITAVTIGPELGYTGQRTFHNAAQALNWLKPHHHSANYVSESWRDKRFQKRLGIDDLARWAQVPDQIIAEWNRRNPTGR